MSTMKKKPTAAQLKMIQTIGEATLTSASISIAITMAILLFCAFMFHKQGKLLERLHLSALGMILTQAFPPLAMLALLGGWRSECQTIMRVIILMNQISRFSARWFLLDRIRVIFAGTARKMKPVLYNSIVALLLVSYIGRMIAMWTTQKATPTGIAKFTSSKVYLCKAVWPASLPIINTAFDVAIAAFLVGYYAFELYQIARMTERTSYELLLVVKITLGWSTFALLTDFGPAIANQFGGYGMIMIGIATWTNSLSVWAIFFFRPIYVRMFGEPGDMSKMRATISMVDSKDPVRSHPQETSTQTSERAMSESPISATPQRSIGDEPPSDMTL